ncbi:hypothetical protein [Ornithinimicrobium avium]|uniref:LppX_LprAFG lipoprotein n=1 Tax=Ornithinimicrobium avium TaxID=2283195 RepID=A0A345NQL7_9MICO|nr:hypothetical protein [Ornithinimicrobium avium]AXH97325.1 hypothetical protein DV701_15465 [Ornithinimicrobium avium]
MKSTHRRWAGLLTAGALGLSLVACGGDDPAGRTTDVPTGTTQESATGTEAAGESSTETAAGTEAATPAEGQEVDIQEFLAMLKSPGEEKLSSYTLDMVMNMGSQEMDMSGKADLSGDSPAFDIEMTLPGMGEAHMILAGGEVFMSMPGVTQEGKFMQVPKEQLGDAASQLDEVDITTTWDAWEEGASKVVFLGEDDVDGQQMRHYEVTVDSAAALDASGQTGDDAAAASAMMGEEITYEVWLDADNLMRKIAFELDGVVSEIHADNWGEPMDIQAPTAEEIQEGLPSSG